MANELDSLSKSAGLDSPKYNSATAGGEHHNSPSDIHHQGTNAWPANLHDAGETLARLAVEGQTTIGSLAKNPVVEMGALATAGIALLYLTKGESGVRSLDGASAAIKGLSEDAGAGFRSPFRRLPEPIGLRLGEKPLYSFNGRGVPDMAYTLPEPPRGILVDFNGPKLPDSRHILSDLRAPEKSFPLSKESKDSLDLELGKPLQLTPPKKPFNGRGVPDIATRQ